MLSLLGISIQYCEEYKFSYHQIECPTNTIEVYKYNQEYYYLMSDG